MPLRSPNRFGGWVAPQPALPHRSERADPRPLRLSLAAREKTPRPADTYTPVVRSGRRHRGVGSTAGRVMRVVLAESFGMCFGVRDAVELALTAPYREDLTVLGELVHNPDVLGRLRGAGV